MKYILTLFLTILICSKSNATNIIINSDTTITSQINLNGDTLFNNADLKLDNGSINSVIVNNATLTINSANNTILINKLNAKVTITNFASGKIINYGEIEHVSSNINSNVIIINNVGGTFDIKSNPNGNNISLNGYICNSGLVIFDGFNTLHINSGGKFYNCGTINPIITITQDAQSIYVTDNCDICDQPNPLPVELKSFTGIKNGRDNIIKWITYSEINSDYFILYKSVDLENWIELDKITASGFSNSQIEYSLIDKIPYEITYYKLIQVDYNGDSYEKGIISVYNNDLKNYIITNNIIAFNFALKAIIYDINGKEILTKSNISEIDVSQLSSGVYILLIDGKYLKFFKI